MAWTAKLNLKGPAGPGVPAGGTLGQILFKTVSGADYATAWKFLTTGDVLEHSSRLYFTDGRAAAAAQPALATVDAGALHKTGNEAATGTKQFQGGIGVAVPTDYWTSSPSVIFGSEGYLGTNGSFAVSLRANGYRNTGTGWTSMARGGFPGASGIDLTPNGIVRLGADNLAPTGFDTTWRWEVLSDRFRPFIDNAYTFGDAGRRPSVIYAATGAINTSDGREKTVVEPLTPDELAAAADLARAIGTYQWLASIAEKGAANARHHAGLTVQCAIQIMQDHDLDPFAYGFICYDAWSEVPEQIETWDDEYQDVEVAPAVTRDHPAIYELTQVYTEDGQPERLADRLVSAAWTEVVTPAVIDRQLSRPAGSCVTQESQPAGDRYSLRTDEMNMWIARGLIQLVDDQRAEVDDMKVRLDVLERAEI